MKVAVDSDASIMNMRWMKWIGNWLLGVEQIRAESLLSENESQMLPKLTSFQDSSESDTDVDDANDNDDDDDDDNDDDDDDYYYWYHHYFYHYYCYQYHYYLVFVYYYYCIQSFINIYDISAPHVLPSHVLLLAACVGKQGWRTRRRVRSSTQIAAVNTNPLTESTREAADTLLPKTLPTTRRA